MAMGLPGKALLTAALLAAGLVAVAPAQANNGRAKPWHAAAPSQTYPYYVEFRADENGIYGHSYVAYGRRNARGQPVSAAYADIHPAGDWAGMVLGHFLPVDAETRPDPGTPRLPIVSYFRQPLTASGYRRLLDVVAHLRAENRAWSVIGYNCNDFVADVARGLGMRAPSTLLFPYDFIPALKLLNEPAPATAYAAWPRRRLDR